MFPDNSDPEIQPQPRRLQAIPVEIISNTKTQMIIHGILAMSLVGTAITIAGGLYYLGANPIADRWLKPLDESLQENIANVDKTIDKYLKDGKGIELEKERLREQLTLILNKEKQNRIIAVDYYKWLFVVLSITSGSAVVSGVSLFYISKEGWEKANNYMINVFIVSSTVAVLVGSLSVMFKMQSNADERTGAFIAYDNLYNQILTKLATIDRSSPVPPPPPNSPTKTVSQQLQALINSNENLLGTYNKMAISFDDSNIRLPDLPIK